MYKINPCLITDFYELTMMQGYFFNCPDSNAVFEMFFRQQPFRGGYTVFAGLAPLLDKIEEISFDAESISYLESQKIFHPEFLDFLSTFRFTGDIFSVAEGTIIFPNEPLLRIHGSLMETQLLESMVLNYINFQSLVATKTARIVHSAKNSPVLEFGLRRAQGLDGSISATRASYIGGASSTSNTIAGKKYNIPVSGTMAHSWIMGFDSELEAFEKYASLYPGSCVLLVDTFDTLKSGLPNAIKVFNKIKNNPGVKMAIRIDSGDLEYLSKKSRDMLDKNNLAEVQIFVSSDLDEWIISQLKNSHSPIDAWGVGTRLVTGHSDPALTGVYKIVARGTDHLFEPCIKISNQSEKITNPGIKNTMRFYDNSGQAIADLLYLEDEKELIENKIKNRVPIQFNHPSTDYSGFTLKNYSNAESLLRQVMKEGKTVKNPPDLEDIRKKRQTGMESLDETYKRLLNPHTYKVSLSENLKNTKTGLIRKIQKDFNY